MLHTSYKNLDPDSVNDEIHADITMEMKIKLFVKTCWNKRCSSFMDNELLPPPGEFCVETYSMIPLLNSVTPIKYNQALIINIFYYVILCICS